MRFLIPLCAAAFLIAAPAAIAQQSSQNMMGNGMMNQGMMTCGHMSMSSMMHAGQHIEGRLAFLKTELKITDAQAPQWNAYADALRANAKRMHEFRSDMMSKGMMMGQGMMGQGMMGQGMMGQGMMGQGMMGQGMMNQGMMNQGQAGKTLTVPEHLALAEQHMAGHMEMLGAIKEPLTDLYGVLGDEQKQMADELLMGHMGMM
jgi:hypothetical protein